MPFLFIEYRKLLKISNDELKICILKEEPTLSHCAWARTFDLVIRWQI
jgi:hypothetical protein